MRQASPQTISLASKEGDAQIAVTIYRHAAARRMILRYYPPGFGRGQRIGMVLTLPPHVPLGLAQKFLTNHQDWMMRQIQKTSATQAAPQNQAVPFAAGNVIPILGIDHHICCANPPHHGDKIQIENGAIMVAAAPPFIPDLLTVFLKNRARQELQTRSDKMIAHLAVLRPECAHLSQNPKKIRIGDASTRWGSCSSAQILRYNWRLIFAPPAIVDYVVAHEVAHLAEMNHSPRFWALVTQLVGNYRPHRAWLKQNGKRLFAYGRGA